MCMVKHNGKSIIKIKLMQGGSWALPNFNRPSSCVLYQVWRLALHLVFSCDTQWVPTYRSGIPCSRPEVVNNYFRSFFPFAMDKFQFSRFTHSPWLRVLKVFTRFAYRILAVGWQGIQDILTVQFRILLLIFFVICATARVTRPLLARRSVLLIQFVGAWDWVLGLAAFWSPHRHGIREQGCHHHPIL